MKPDKSSAPRWANYMAQDKDGDWYWFEDEPEPDVRLNVWLSSDGEVMEAGYGELLDDWRDTLESISD